MSSHMERHILGALLHYRAPLAVLGALIVCSVCKVQNVPKHICWVTMIAGGSLYHVVVANMKKGARGLS